MAGLALIAENHLGVSTSMVTTSGFDAHPLFLGDKVQVAMLGTTSGPWCVMGTGPAEELGGGPYRAIVGYTSFSMDVVVLDKSGIKTFKDLEGKTVGIGVSGLPWLQGSWDALVGGYELDASKIRSEWFDDFGAAFDALKSGAFDALFMPAEHPNSAYVELFSNFPGRLLDYTEPGLSKTLELALEGLNIPALIPGGTYSTMPDAYHAFGGGSFISVQAYLPDDFIYELTKAAFDYQDEWSRMHISANEISVDKAKATLTFCPFHPGAIQYYKDIGVWTDEMDQMQADYLAKLPPESRYP